MPRGFSLMDYLTVIHELGMLAITAAALCFCWWTLWR